MVERANVIWLDESDKDKTNVIYMLIFPNWKYYIGQTSQKLYERISRGHSRILDNPRNRKDRAVKKYKTFHVMVLDNCKDLDELNIKEQYWIELYDTFNNGYNSTTGGDSYKMSDEARKKIGEYNKGKIITEDHRRILSKTHKGKIISDETRKKIGKSNKGKIFTDEHRIKLSNSHKGRMISEDHRKKLNESHKNISDEARKKNSESHSIKCKSIPDNIIFDSIKQCVEYYSKYDKWIKIQLYLDNGKIHIKSGQTFVRLI